MSDAYRLGFDDVPTEAAALPDPDAAGLIPTVDEIVAVSAALALLDRVLEQLDQR